MFDKVLHSFEVIVFRICPSDSLEDLLSSFWKHLRKPGLNVACEVEVVSLAARQELVYLDVPYKLFNIPSCDLTDDPFALVYLRLDYRIPGTRQVREL